MAPEWPDLSKEVEAFGTLANETRLRILVAVAHYWGREGEAVRYTDLKDAVGIEDSGQFNYHLDRLRDRFVQEENGGYVTTAQAGRVLDSIQSRRYRDVDIDPQPVEGHCPICGGGMHVGYHWNFYVGCGDCWEPHVYRHRVSPTALEHRDPREVMLEHERVWRCKLAANLEGTCIECGCPTEFTFARIGDSYEDDGTTMQEFRVATYCRGCSYTWRGTAGQFLLAHPGVREYCDDHGIDLDAKPFWCYEWVLTDLTTVVHGEDPWRVEKVATVDGCRLAAVFTDDGSVETITHVDFRRDERDDGRQSGERERDTRTERRADSQSSNPPERSVERSGTG
jgi:hypothetical protein